VQGYSNYLTKDTAMDDKPRFFIDDSDDFGVAKSKYTFLTRAEILHTFLNLACYNETSIIRDVGDPDNRKNARKWLQEHIDFLTHDELTDLIEVWDRAAEDATFTKDLFVLVKLLIKSYT
jgi:hypothetical protein